MDISKLLHLCTVLVAGLGDGLSHTKVGDLQLTYTKDIILINEPKCSHENLRFNLVHTAMYTVMVV